MAFTTLTSHEVTVKGQTTAKIPFAQVCAIAEPSVTAPPYGKQLWLCISDEMRKAGLSWEEREADIKLRDASLRKS